MTIKDLNTGWIGLVISWGLQLVLTYFVALVRLTSIVIAYKIEKIPADVLDFAYYHLLKGKSEDDVRMNCRKKDGEKLEIKTKFLKLLAQFMVQWN
ncbi:hypothetical protein DBR27_11570 [Flavobacterium sp. HMWF030]|nr:hypothetical protein DBR27_11570 [Flavobacterium sp. HMWF030]